MRRPTCLIACAFAVLALLYPACAFSGAPALVPMEREGTLDALPPDVQLPERKSPGQERVRIKKEDISGTALVGRKDPLVTITSPAAGELSRGCVKVAGKVGGGIAKVFLLINRDAQIVSVTDGGFESFRALSPGMNNITVLAWDLEGNLGKNSVKVFYRPDPAGPEVDMLSPADGSFMDVTEDRVVRVRARTTDNKASRGVLVVNGMTYRVVFDGGVMEKDIALMPGRAEIFVELEGSSGRVARSRTVAVDTFDSRPKDLVAVLSWDSPVADLDLHVWDSSDHHTSARAPDSALSAAAIPRGMLDMDRKGSYGPEVFSLDSAESEVYTFYVKYSQGVDDGGGAGAYLDILLHGEDPSRRLIRTFGPVRLDASNPSWQAAHVKMPEGVFFQEKDADLVKTLGMDANVVKRLAMMLKEENTAFGLLAVAAMGMIKSEESVGPLLEALSRGAPEMRRAAAGALWSIKSPRSVEGLIGALKDEDAEVRLAAAGALGRIGDRRAYHALTSIIAGGDIPPLRVAAVRALGLIGDTRALDTLVSQASDQDASVRVEAARALGRLGDDRGAGALVKALADERPGVRESAARALGMLRAGVATRPLMDLLYFDGEERVRVQAAVALGRLGDPSAADELERAVEKDQSDRVRFCAKKALTELRPEGPAAGGSPKRGVPDKEAPPAWQDDDVIISY